MTAPGFTGADPEQLRALADKFDHGADALERIRSTVGQDFGRAHWAGHDAERFWQEWRGRQAGVMAAVSKMMREAARALRANASEQSQASQSGVGQTGAGQPSGVPDVAVVMTLAGTLLKGMQAIEWTMDLRGKLGKDVALVGDLTDLKRLSEFARPFKVSWLNALSLGADVNELREELSRGEINPGTLFKVAWDVASLHPVGGLVTGAWDTGVFLGTGIGNYLQEQTHYQDAIFASIVADRYDGPLTPERTAEMSERYSGAWGYVNITSDLLVSEAHFVQDTFKSWWDKVF